MIVRQFADHAILKRLTNVVADKDTEGIAWPNLLVNATTSDYKKELDETSFTLISNIQGQADCTIDGRYFKVCSSAFLLTNPFQQLVYSTVAKEKIETTNIHFNYGFIQNLYSYFTVADSSLLDNVDHTENTMPLFFNELHFKTNKIQKQKHAAGAIQENEYG